LYAGAYLPDYLDRQEQFGVICLIEKLSNAPIAAIALTDLRDDIGIEEVGHEALPDIEQIVVVRSKAFLQDLLERTLWRLAKKGYAKYLAMLGLCTATMRRCTEF
jgi:hypothetical protein